VVKKGDTLWDIAQYFLRDAWQWPELWYTNSQVRNPHLIYPGDVLTLINVDGRPRLVREGPVERLSPRVREEAIDASLP
ncbi:LysM peptidoglycan-binding domain-containing protein, partial [Escherichia coli]|uniref:LysM peptidoglycan-binding domain-containing protein n=2 Tax=Gammaproteobacteria TaxID=1236 RepID=UPI00215B0672